MEALSLLPLGLFGYLPFLLGYPAGTSGLFFHVTLTPMRYILHVIVIDCLSPCIPLYTLYTPPSPCIPCIPVYTLYTWYTWVYMGIHGYTGYTGYTWVWHSITIIWDSRFIWRHHTDMIILMSCGISKGSNHRFRKTCGFQKTVICRAAWQPSSREINCKVFLCWIAMIVVFDETCLHNSISNVSFCCL